MLDLACGTGTVALSFATRGWEVFGIDASSGMLAQARHKSEQARLDLALSQQDMRSFVLPHPVGLITCLYDSLNYMLTLADLQRVFVRVAAHLRPRGAFLADMNTQWALEQVWGNNTFFVEGNDLALILASGYEPQTHLSSVEIVGFVRKEDGRYERFAEHHTEMAYSEEEIRLAFAAAGLQVEAAYTCFGLDAPAAETRRIMWVARKPGDAA